MNLTAQELSAASTLVAAVAIVTGYLGVRSANRSATAIARDERAARHHSDHDRFKRAIYAEFIVALAKLADDQMTADLAARKNDKDTATRWQRTIESAQTAENKLAQLALLAPPAVHNLAEAAFRRALNATEHDIRHLAADADNLLKAMRTDLDS